MELELRDLSVKFKGKEVLKSINLRVEDGEFVSLLGASGCGKTTSLKVIAGIVEQDSGSVYLGGNLADGLPAHKRGTVIVFQDFRLFPHMTVAENIAFPLKMKGLDKKLRRKKVLDLLKKVRLEDYEEARVDKMSGGQIQRIALARALAAEPKVLLLDEPFSSLDVNLRKDMRQLVLDLQKEYGITTVLVTHDQEEALTMSDRIAFMQDGRIEQYASPEEIFKYPVNKKVADYFSDGSYIEGEVLAGTFKSSYFNFPVDLEDGCYSCLLRPIALRLKKDEAGDYSILSKLYMGDRYLVKLSRGDLILEALVEEDFDLASKLSLDIDPDKLIFIKK